MKAKIHISTYVDTSFYDELKSYCHKNQITLSSLIGLSLRKQISNDWELDILAKCENLIDHKMALAPHSIDVKARPIK